MGLSDGVAWEKENPMPKKDMKPPTHIKLVGPIADMFKGVKPDWTGLVVGGVYKLGNQGTTFTDCLGEIRYLDYWNHTSVVPEEPGITSVDRHIQETFGPLSDDPLVNPKKAAGAVKAPLHAYPMLPIVQMANVMGGGAHKYGIYNYRESKVDALTYIGAFQRHIMLWADGQDQDKESKQSHLAHAMACCAILLDCQLTGNLIDNRSKTGLMEKELERSQRTFAEYIDKVQSIEERNSGN